MSEETRALEIRTLNYNLFLKEKLIAIGWNKIGDLSKHLLLIQDIVFFNYELPLHIYFHFISSFKIEFMENLLVCQFLKPFLQIRLDLYNI